MRIFRKHGWQYDRSHRMVRGEILPGGVEGTFARLAAALRVLPVYDLADGGGGHGHWSGRCGHGPFRKGRGPAGRPCYLKKAVQWMRRVRAGQRRKLLASRKGGKGR